MMTSKKISVVVSCSVKFHAFALVEQLEKNGVEVMFFTTYSSIVNTFFSRFTKRMDKEIINPKSIKTNIILAILLKLYRRSPQFVNNLFDLWVSKKLRKLDADFFIGWSGMSLNSINVAKSKGWKTFLERGSTHILFQENLLLNTFLKYGVNFKIEKSTIIKELQEYSCADFISIPARLVEKSFLEYGIPKNKLLINPYGADLKNFKPLDINKTDNKLRILFFGKVLLRKGFVELIQAVEKYKNEIRLVVVGSVNDFEIHDFIDKIKNEPHIKFLGHLDHSKINEVINSSDIGIVPSLEDGYAMVVPQMLSSGIPVIVSTNTGSEELIEDSINGWIVEPTAEGIENKLLFLLKNKPVIEEMRKNIISNGFLNLSWDEYGIRYYNNLCKLGRKK